jgi:O-antigen/teichoic acid export membrane protein
LSGASDKALAIGRRLGPRTVLNVLISRPTWIAQGIAAFSSLILVVLLTRSLSPAAYAAYSVVMATYAFAMALVGTTINTRVIEEGSATPEVRIRLSVSRDMAAMGGCVLAAIGAALITNRDPLVTAAAAAGMVGTLIAQLAGAHLLSQRRFWGYAVLVLFQVAVWDLVSFIAVLQLPPGDKLSGVLFAVAAGGIPGAIYLLRNRVLSIGRNRGSHRHSAISAIGVASLALWVLASGDRIILARYSLASLATYVATYGLLDRVFRTLAAAETQQRLPDAFRSYAKSGRVESKLPRFALILMLLVGGVLGLCTPTIVSLISGGNYRPPLLMAMELSLAMVAMLAAVPAFVTLIATARARTAAHIAIVAAVTNIVGNLLLAARFGTKSAAALTLLGYLIWWGGVVFAARQPQDHDSVGQASEDERDFMASAEQVTS